MSVECALILESSSLDLGSREMLRVLTPSEKLPSCQATSSVARYVIADAYQEMFGDSRSGTPTPRLW